MSTRRDVLLHGAISAGVLASNVSGVAALAAATPPLRRSLAGLAWNDPIVATYRDAVGIMKQMAATEKFSWKALATIHGFENGNFHYCPHGDWYFLPWHRAFTAMYERVVRKLTQNAGFAMPYWDWTTDPMFPSVFIEPKTPDGKTNWLCVQEPNRQRTWDMKKPFAPEIVGPDVLKKILTATGYENFGTSRNPAQTNTNASWVPAGGGVQGVLEGTPHNLVHNNIGGWMPSSSSPRDPIFFMHHANIDRIWALWNTHNANSTNPLWTGMRFTDNFWNMNGSPWSPAVSDLYVPETLGYTYGLTPARRITTPKFLTLTNKLNTVFALRAGQLNAPGGVTTVSVANDKAATASQPLDIAIDLPVAALQAVRMRAPAGAGADLMNFEAVREEAATGTRVFAFLREVTFTDPATTMFRIFVDGDGVSARTPLSDPHYVGTFGVLAHGGHDGHGGAPSFVLDLTAALARTGGGAVGRVRLQLVPVPIDAPGATAGTATPSRIEVTLINN